MMRLQKVENLGGRSRRDPSRVCSRRWQTTLGFFLVAAGASVSEGLTIESNLTRFYAPIYSTARLVIQGSGFRGDGKNLHLKFMPSLLATSVAVTSETSLSVVLKQARCTNQARQCTLFLSSLKDALADDPDKELVTSPLPVATIVEAPDVRSREGYRIYMMSSKPIYVEGTYNYIFPKEASFDFDPPLYRDVDYVAQVTFDPYVMTLKTGRKWRSDGEPGLLRITRMKDDIGEVWLNRTLATILADPTIETRATTTTLYQTLSRELWVRGTGFAFDKTRLTLRVRYGANRDKFAPLTYAALGVNSTHVHVWLQNGEKWSPEVDNNTVLECTSIAADGGPVVAAGGPVDGVWVENPIAIAKIVKDPASSLSAATATPTIEAHDAPQRPLVADKPAAPRTHTQKKPPDALGGDGLHGSEDWSIQGGEPVPRAAAAKHGAVFSDKGKPLNERPSCGLQLVLVVLSFVFLVAVAVRGRPAASITRNVKALLPSVAGTSTSTTTTAKRAYQPPVAEEVIAPRDGDDNGKTGRRRLLV
eukprot:CAMPEP_0118912644 /NCGR_PEP_ID=MMETSP1166-20130328/13792_1 /TAXON_ID=1104430 /ORGANISM="Chrysoreinhardia sp, Strain CCMP3193" /LENGTH=532 /DNA_ID=CAMNT_0006852163 /DNA_START=3 /DNA_END=1601 /DNA_ORIENTATION=+